MDTVFTSGVKNESKAMEKYSQGKSKEQLESLGMVSSFIKTPSQDIAGIFFKLPLGFAEIQHKDSIENRRADEKVGDVECYVFFNEFRNKMTRTLWIGKQDFLIHQIKSTVNVDALNARADKPAQTPIPKSVSPNQPKVESTGISIETHTNIVLNPKYVPSDFTH